MPSKKRKLQLQKAREAKMQRRMDLQNQYAAAEDPSSFFLSLFARQIKDCSPADALAPLQRKKKKQYVKAKLFRSVKQNQEMKPHRSTIYRQ